MNETSTPLFHYKGFSIPVDLLMKTGGIVETWDSVSTGHLRQYQTYAPIQPHHRVLEVGCGVGRDAIQLIDVLKDNGEYFGMDIILPSIEWCQKNITPKHPNFKFFYYDIQSQIHNTDGTVNTPSISFPLQNGTVDRIILQSVFTHMFEEDITHYLKEFRRVLKPDGLVVASFFIADPESLRSAHENNTKNDPHAPLRFEHSYGGEHSGCFINEKEYPEGAVAYTEEAVKRMLQASGLVCDQPIHHGNWSARYNSPDLQDIVVLRIPKEEIKEIIPTQPDPVPLFHYKGFHIPIPLIDLTGGGVETWDMIGKGHMDQYNAYAPIKPDHHVLEVGSGVGRDAMQLIDLLNEKGRYTGFDIIRPSIEWCQQNITPKHPNFTFFYFDIQSQIHNAGGSIKTPDVRLPAADESIDRIILQSVFTHMFEEDITHYLKEFHRVLKPNGRVVASIFITDPESLRMAQTANEKSNIHKPLKFEHTYGPKESGCFINDQAYPEGAVGYTEEALQRMLSASGMELDQPIHRGLWCGRTGTTDGQDMLVLKKRAS